ncbi:MAG: GerAB/ArcD/ProY family transporter [Clostridia bacterium]|nr:GerAB/ArcD/ProY family transporter [Clostridia bacterium]
MNSKANYTLHTIFLCAIFLMGNAVIILPFPSADDKTFLGYIFAFFISFGVCFLLLPILNNLYTKKAFKNSFQKAVFIALYGATALLSAIEAYRCFYQYADFVSKTVLPKVSPILISLIFIAIAIYLSFRHSSVIFKFSLFSFVLVFIAVAAFFIMSYKNFRLDNISLLQLPTSKKLIKQTIPYLLKVFLPFLLVLIYQACQFERIGKKQTLWGLSLGGITLALTLLNSVLLFGAPLSASLDFPYASAISTVTVGYLFSRMDGFSYFIYFACCLIKISVCIGIIKSLIKRIFG